MTAATSAKGLAYWPLDPSSPVMEMTAGDALRRAAEQTPDRTALVEVAPEGAPSTTGAASTQRRWTYRELLGDATKCAHWLLQRHRPGDRICIWAPNVPEWVVLQYGAALAGLVLVTANPALRAGELAYVIEQSQSSSLFYTESFRGTDMSAIAREVSKQTGALHSLTGWLAKVRETSEGAPLPDVGPDEPAQIQYTSGTTGKPKGALLSHKSLVTNASLVAGRAGTNKSTVLSPMPLFHTAGAVLSCLGSIVTSSTYVLPLLFDPELMMKTIMTERCDVFFGVPTMQIALLGHPKRAEYDLSSLRVSISGGASVPRELLKRIEAGFGCDMLAVYGQTEASPIICQTSPSDSIDDKALTAGRPLPQVEVRIADPVSGETVAVGVEGEIQARGYQTMLGYYNMEAATCSTLTEDKWLRTGDLGTMDERGYLKVTGRLKDMIIRGGENIYPAELEARLLEHPRVANVSVFGAPDAHWGEVVCAAIQFREEQDRPTGEELKAHCRQALAPGKVPTRWFSCDAFPMTGSGKIQKFRLQEFLKDGQLTELGT